MLKEFNKKKSYIFSKDVALKNDKTLKANYESGNATYWVDYCNGRAVKVKTSQYGIINDEKLGSNYCIYPYWCERDI